MTLHINHSEVAVPDSANHGVFYLQDPRNMYEIQRLNNFELTFTLEGIINLVTGQPFTNPDEIVRLSVTEAAIPHFSQSEISVKRGNAEYWYAGIPSFPDNQIVFNDYIGLDTKEVLMSWQHMSYNVDTQHVGLVSDYKKNIKLTEYSPDYQMVRQWDIYGAWIKDMSEGTYNMESNSMNKITCRFRYDWAKLSNSNVREQTI